MKRKITFLIAAAVMLLTMVATTSEMWGQTRETKTEGFETATAATIYNSTATVATNQSDCGIGWSIYYGNVSTTQAITGDNSCLIRYYTTDEVLGYAKTTTGIQGLSNITFNAKVTNTGNKMGVWYSTDGDNWTALATDVTLTTSAASKSYDIPNSSSSNTYYVKIGLTTGSSTNKKDLIFDDVVFTYSTGGGSTVSTPTITPNGGIFVNSQEVTITCDTEGAAIYYTLNGSTPTTSSTLYNGAFTITESKTVKAFAVKQDYNDSQIATAEFTKVTPLANIAALTANTETGTYYVTLTNAVVTFVNGSNAYIQDASGAVAMYKSGHGLTAGDVLNGTATVSYQLRNNNPQITNMSGITPASGAAPNPTSVAQSAWNYTFNDVLSQYFQIKGATITQSNGKYYVELGSDNVQLYKASGNISTLNLSKTYTIVGFPTLYNTTKELQIFADPTYPAVTTNPASADPFNYIVGSGPSTEQLFGVTGTNLTSPNITVSVPAESAFEITENTVYGNSVTIASGDMVSVRMKAGLALGNYNANLSISTEGATTLEIALTGSVSNVPTYTVTYDGNGATSGDAPVDNNNYISGAAVTVLGPGTLAKTGHSFAWWTTDAEGNGDPYEEDDTYTITANTTFYAQWETNTHTVTLPANDAYGDYSMNKTNPVAYNTEVTLTYTKASGYDNYKATWSVNGTPIAGNKFNMPDADVTVTVSVEEMTQASYIFNTDAGLSDLGIDKPGTSAGTNLGSATYSVGLVDMTCTNGSTATRVWNSGGTLTLRVYENGTLTFEVPSTPVAYVITKVEFGGTVNLTYGSNPATAVSNKTWTGQASSITFKNTSSQSQITTITVTYARLRTLSFWVNGTEAPALEKGVANGAKIGTLPTTPSGIPSGYTFDGWMDLSNSDNYYGSSAPTMVTTNTVVTDDMLLAAVFHETSTSSNYTTSIVTYDLIIDDDLYGINYISGDVLASSFENHGLLIINNGSTLEMDDGEALTNSNPDDLIIEDGGQLILAKTNTGVAATVKKDVSAATAGSKTDATYWYALSADVENPLISSNTNLITESGGDPTYDLYRLNEEKNAGDAWENYRNALYSTSFTTLEKGRGYLYRNASDLTITMTGDINVEDFTYDVTKTDDGEYAGFNLIGNPYTHDIYKGAGTAITDGTSTLSTGFYYLEPSTGKWAKGTDKNTAIAPNQGILVQVDATGYINMTNTISNGSAKSNNDYIMLSVANSQYSDEAYAWFDKGIGLNKIEHRNSEIPMLYINQDGENFAIATMSDDTKSFNLNFKAMTTGKYTLSYKADGNFNYLHVIDRLTGEDVDMLLEGEYSFIASPIDSENRFIVRLEYSAGSEISESSIFAYQSGNDIIVNGEGELQIFDMMGRRVLTQYVSGVETINLQLNGVYIFRLNEKTQKIVVK